MENDTKECVRRAGFYSQKEEINSSSSAQRSLKKKGIQGYIQKESDAY